MSFQETEYGFELITMDFVAFFGKHNSSLQNLRAAYPYLDWSWVKQVHGDKLCESTYPYGGEIEADAQWTSQPNIALITKTADCMPVLGFNRSKRAVVSVHSGWRGVAQKIVTKSLEDLSQQKHPISGWEIFVGPHILKDSFQIKDDAFKLLAQSTSTNPSAWAYPNNEGYRVDLMKIVNSQLVSGGISSTGVHVLAYDTLTDLRFHSFRRDRENSGRQISFIALL